LRNFFKFLKVKSKNKNLTTFLNLFKKKVKFLEELLKIKFINFNNFKKISSVLEHWKKE
jgi:hypothetical protein